MNLTSWKPFNAIMPMHDRINRLFEDEIAKGADRGSGTLSSWYPAADIYETKSGYIVKLEVPGISKDDIAVEFHENSLLVKGERKEEKEVNEEKYHRVERFYGSFSRNFIIPSDVAVDKINATLNDGILELVIPKSEEKEAKTIAINAA